MRKDRTNLRPMAGRYVRAYLKPGTAIVNINVSEDGFPSSEHNIAAGLEPSDAKVIVGEYLAKGYLVYQTFLTSLWEAGEAMKRKPYWNQIV